MAKAGCLFSCHLDDATTGAWVGTRRFRGSRSTRSSRMRAGSWSTGGASGSSTAWVTGPRPTTCCATGAGRRWRCWRRRRASVSLGAAEPQALAYAAGLGVPFVFLANGEEVRFRDLDRDAHFRPVATVVRAGGSGAADRDAHAARAADEHRRRREGRGPRLPARLHQGAVSARWSWAGASCWSRWRPGPARRGWPRP